MPLLSYGKTDIGRKRMTNQDAILIDPKHLLCLVADGMGGHQAGDIAAQTAIVVFQEFIQNNFHLEKKRLLQEALSYTNATIYKKAQADSKLKGMGTTVTAHLYHEGALSIVHVGDSRSYLLSQGELFQLTKDHTFVQEKINLGIYTREQAHLDKMKNVLLKTVGFDAQVESDIYSYKVLKNDLFLLCSDGLYGRLSNLEILGVLLHTIPDPASAQQKDLENCVNALISMANERGGQDNISVILSLAH
ncbi:MAG: Stp1/IreP family PP2C-type Ser/Thr phosphatase [Bacteriovoracaceae bacterium]|nr:Stp1/IreP family PP2C-type Ser/Thr phosphatase [Bacteriovoracaceae bacterium]